MVNEKKKIGKMIDEVTTFFLKKGHYKLRIDLDYTKKFMVLRIHIPNLSANESEMITKCFSQKRDLTMEEYGWELMGESETSSELNLVGMCIDSFSFEDAEDGITILEIKRNHN